MTILSTYHEDNDGKDALSSSGTDLGGTSFHSHVTVTAGAFRLVASADLTLPFHSPDTVSSDSV